MTRDSRASAQLTLLLTAISWLGPFAIDTYLPSFAEMGASLHVSMVQVQQTLTAYLVPFALMTLWHGAISDVLGRRRVILAGLTVFSLASLGCAVATRFPVLLACRAAQGMVAGVGMVVGRAVVRDVAEGAQAQRLMSHVAIAFALAPAVAPIIGGWLHVWAGWRAVFVFLAAVSGLIALACWRGLPETLPVAQRRPWAPRALGRSYLRTLTTPAFIGVSLSVTFFFAGMFVYVLSAPVFILRHLGLHETQFGWLFVPNTMAMMFGSWLSGRAAGRVSRRATLGLGLAIMAAAASTNMALHHLPVSGVAWRIAPISVYVVGMALTMPSLTLMALDLFPQHRGLAASCQGFLQSGFNSIMAGAIAPLLWSTSLGLARGQVAFVLLGSAALATFWLTTRPHRGRTAQAGAA